MQIIKDLFRKIFIVRSKSVKVDQHDRELLKMKYTWQPRTSKTISARYTMQLRIPFRTMKVLVSGCQDFRFW